MKNRQKNSALLLCIAIMSSALWGCGQTIVEETAEDVAVVEVANPKIGDLKLSGNFIATINPDESVYVIPKTTGEVLEVMVEAGDVVKEGDVLCYVEAMKTYNAIRAEFSGTITAICANPGDTVSEDDVLMKIG